MLLITFLLFSITLIIIANIIIIGKEKFSVVDQKTIDEINKSDNQNNNAYNELLEQNMLGVEYYYNDYFDHYNVVENSWNVITNTEKVDYSKLKKSGLEKCLKKCNGLCTSWYDGNAACFPITQK